MGKFRQMTLELRPLIEVKNCIFFRFRSLSFLPIFLKMSVGIYWFQFKMSVGIYFFRVICKNLQN